MKVVTSPTLPGLGFLFAGAALSLVGCQSGAVSSSKTLRPIAFAIEAGASLQDESSGQEEGKDSKAEGLHAPDAKSKGEGKSRAEKLSDAAEKRLLAEQKLVYAEMETKLAELDQQAGAIELAESLRAKQAALQAASEELESFKARKMPLELREAKLGLDRSSDRLLKAETDLANMREIMSEEAEAKNKGEIIRRYETSFKFAQEGLAIETEKRALLVEAEHPSKLAKLSGAVRAAEAKLQAEQIHTDRKQRAAELKVSKAQHGFDQAGRELKKALRKETELKDEVAALAGGAEAAAAGMDSAVEDKK